LVSRIVAFAFRAGLTITRAPRIRSIDDMTASDINSATGAQEKMSYDTLDLFLESLRQLKSGTQVQHLACHGRPRELHDVPRTT
jgi:hypothetical protein